MGEDVTPGAGDGGNPAGDVADAGGAPAEVAYELPASLQGFKDQIRPEHRRQLEEQAREQGLDQAGFEAFVTEAYGSPAAELAELEREFGSETAQTLKSLNVFAAGLSKDHGEAVSRLVGSASGVKLLNDLRVAGAGDLDLAKHAQAVKVLKASEAGRTLLHAIEQAGKGVAMPGVPAAAPRLVSAERPPVGKTAEELGAMMKDPRYWRDKDPAYIEEVTRGYQELYGGQVQTAAIAPTSSRR